MFERRTVWYLAAVLGVAALAAFYAQRRDLRSRYIEFQESQDTLRRDGERLQMLQKRESELRQRVDHLVNDPVEMEAEVRRSKNRVREGETIYRIEPDVSPGQSTPSGQ